MSEKECIFCKIVENKIPAKIVHEDDQTIGFLDIFPISKGHTVVIPKKHYEDIISIEKEEFNNVMEVVKKLSSIIFNKIKPDGINILQNNKKAAGQVVKHFHVHIIPRNEGDDKLDVFTPENQARDKELEKILNLLKE